MFDDIATTSTDEVKNVAAIETARAAVSAIEDAVAKVEQVDVVNEALLALDVARAAIALAIDTALSAGQRDLAVVIAEQAEQLNTIDIKTRSTT